MDDELELRIRKFAAKVRRLTEIDLARLEEEWVKQPKLVGEAAEIHALLKQEVALAKADLEMVEADVKRRVRQNPAKYGVEKATDKPVEEAMVLSDRYQKANRKVIAAQHAQDVLGGILNTLEHRKKALEGAVSLHGQQYFAKPKVPHGAAERFKAEVDRAPFRRRKKSRK